MDHARAIVLADGDPVAPPIELPADALVIAADGGLKHAPAHGLAVDVVIGDMDSVPPEALAAAERSGARIERHPTDKDATDLELAIDAATAAGAREITIVGGAGGRLDHLLGNAMLLAQRLYQGVALDWLTERERVTVADPTRSAVIRGQAGDRVSLIPIGGDARHVSSTGLRWGLDDETLRAGTTRGISNETVGPEATVAVGGGSLLIVHERNPA